MKQLLLVIGLLGGLAGVYRHIIETDTPIDMMIYLEGVRAFLSGKEMYAEPMWAGDIIALPFIYPPFGALVMSPFVVLGIPDAVAGDIVIILSDLAILLILAQIARVILSEYDRLTRWASATVVWALTMFFEPVTLNNGFAQINILLMALAAADLLPGPHPRWLPRGVLLGIAAAIKLTPLAMGLYLLLRKDWRAVFTAACSAIATTLLAALWRWDMTLEFYFGTLLNLGSSSEVGVNTTYQSNSSIKGMLMRWAPSAEALEAHSSLFNTLWLLLALGAVGIGVWIMHKQIARGLFVDAVMINAIVMLLISPISWSHHWVWLALILPVFAWRIVDGTYPRWPLAITLGLWAVILVTNPPKWWFGDAIDLWALNPVQTFLVSDFVWFAFALLAIVATGLVRHNASLAANSRD